MTVRIEQLASPRILAGQPGDIYLYPYGDAALLGSAPTGLSISVVDAAGNAVASGTPSWDATNKRLVFALTAAQNDRPKVLTATWGFTSVGVVYALVSTHETVGELLYTEAEARAYDNAALASATAYPSDELLRMRDQAHDSFEEIVGVALGARYERELVDGSGRQELWLAHQQVSRVRAVSERTAGTTTWTAYNAAALADVLVYGTGRLHRETLGVFASGRQNVAVEYEHGLSPIPFDLRRAALRLTRSAIVPSNISDRAMSETNQLGTFQMAVAGFRKDAWFGIPPVDSVLSSYRRRFHAPAVR